MCVAAPDKDVLISSAIAVLFAAPYFVWSVESSARYFLADLIIVSIVSMRFHRETSRRIGFSMRFRSLVVGIALLIAGSFLAQEVMDRMSLQTGVSVLHARPLFSLSQVLHQEIVLRALLLGALVERFHSRSALAVVVAVIFALLHPVFFWLTHGVTLPATAVATFFAFGLATNFLYLHAGHIGYSFAAHASWNVVRFGGVYMKDGVYILEPQSFVEIEGSRLALVAATTLLAVVVAFWVATAHIRSDNVPG